MSQKDHGHNTEKVEELAEHKSGEINVVSAAAFSINIKQGVSLQSYLLIVNILREKTNQLELFLIRILYISENMNDLKERKPKNMVN